MDFDTEHMRKELAARDAEIESLAEQVVHLAHGLIELERDGSSHAGEVLETWKRMRAEYDAKRLREQA